MLYITLFFLRRLSCTAKLSLLLVKYIIMVSVIITHLTQTYLTNFATLPKLWGLVRQGRQVMKKRQKTKDHEQVGSINVYHSSFIKTRAILFLFSTYPYFSFALPCPPVNKTCKQSFRINCNTFAIVSSVISLSSLEQQVLLILR